MLNFAYHSTNALIAVAVRYHAAIKANTVDQQVQMRMFGIIVPEDEILVVVIAHAGQVIMCNSQQLFVV